jgi:hypothetical protein
MYVTVMNMQARAVLFWTSKQHSNLWKPFSYLPRTSEPTTCLSKFRLHLFRSQVAFCGKKAVCGSCYELQNHQPFCWIQVNIAGIGNTTAGMLLHSEP